MSSRAVSLQSLLQQPDASCISQSEMLSLMAGVHVLTVRSTQQQQQQQRQQRGE